MTKTDRRYRNPAYDPLEETQENPALPSLSKPGRGRWALMVLAIVVVLTILAVLFFT